MQLKVEDFGKYQVCSIIGAISATNSDDFYDQFIQTLEICNKDIIINLEHLEFIDSKGVSTFLIGKKMLAKNGLSLFISNVPKPVRRVFDITFLNKIIPIYEDVKDVPDFA